MVHRVLIDLTLGLSPSQDNTIISTHIDYSQMILQYNMPWKFKVWSVIYLSYCNTLIWSQWRHNERGSDSNHQPRDCLLNCLFRRRSKKTSKLRVAGLCQGDSLVTSEFPSQRASNAENGSIWWHHHVMFYWSYLWFHMQPQRSCCQCM